MTTSCPKCGYIRKASDSVPDYECPACGVIYQKYLNRTANKQNAARITASMQKPVLYSESWKAETRTGTVILIVVFTAMSLFFLREIFFGLQAQHWPKTTGLIAYSYVSSGGRGGDKLNIGYDYFVDGQHYQNDRANFGLLSLDGTFSSARESADHYPAGKSVDVYYQKSDPSNSVLENKINLMGNILWVLLLLSVAGITTYYRFFKTRQA